MGEAAISKAGADMRKGTPAMVEELYTDFYDQLLGWCTARVRSPAAAEDLVQETFLRAMDHLEDLEPLNRAQRRAWLYRTAKNLAVDRVRRQARETPAEEEQLALAGFEEDLTAVAVAQLVDRLPETERALFSLRAFAGYNATELGDLFDLSPSTVRSRLASARRKLVSWYQENN